MLAAIALMRTAEMSTDVDGPASSFPKPGEVIVNHIHANVHFDARKSSTFRLLDKSQAWNHARTMEAVSYTHLRAHET